MKHIIQKSVLLALMLFFSITNILHAQNGRISGHIIDKNLNDLTGAQITNLNTHEKSYANEYGNYSIKAKMGDTLSFAFIGETTEKRMIIDTSKHLNILLINKTVNDLGAIWTKKQYKKAEREINRYYKQLEEKAKKEGKWDN